MTVKTQRFYMVMVVLKFLSILVIQRRSVNYGCGEAESMCWPIFAAVVSTALNGIRLD
jgi:hypothetical protein